MWMGDHLCKLITIEWKEKSWDLRRVPEASPWRRRRHRPYSKNWARTPACCLSIGETWPWPDCTWAPSGSRNWWRSRDPAVSCRPRGTCCSPGDGKAGPSTSRTSCHSVSISYSRRRTPSPTRGRMICSLRWNSKTRFLCLRQLTPSIAKTKLDCAAFRALFITLHYLPRAERKESP